MGGHRIVLLARAAALTALLSASAMAAPPDQAASIFPAGWKQGFVRSVEGRKLSYRWAYPGFAVSLLCRAVDATWAVEWEGETAPPGGPGERVTYVFHVGLNSGPSSHRFELRLDGRPVATFDTAGGTANRTWTAEGADGARLLFLTTRIGSFDERFGFLALEVPRRQLGDGPPRFCLTPEAAGSQDYVLVFEEPVTTWAKVAAEEAVLKGGRRQLTADVSHLGPAVPVLVKAGGREVHSGLSVAAREVEASSVLERYTDRTLPLVVRRTSPGKKSGSAVASVKSASPSAATAQKPPETATWRG